MKYIFDFDDVLFQTTKLKEKIFLTLEEVGVPRNLVKEYLEKERWNCFSLKKMLAHFSVHENLYEKIMNICGDLRNEELFEIVKKIGKENCFIITYGDEEFQQDKIKRAGIAPLFSEVIIVSNSKKETIEKICAEYKNEEIIFIDDSAKHFEDLNLIKYPNLKTVHFKNINSLKDIM
jgi:FMN phosphatase YigB (HAD superfamily)